MERSLRRHGMEHSLDPMTPAEYQAKLMADGDRVAARVGKVVDTVRENVSFGAGVIFPL